jgi:hypothetical protein
MKTKKEVWKKVVTGDGIDWKRYSVSSYGRVRNDSTGKILKSKIDKEYLRAELWKNGKNKFYYVHRLVAMAFIPNDDPLHKTQVNHKNENKTNNTVENLEWCTPEYNINYGTRNERVGESNMKQVIAIDKNGEIVGYYESTLAVEKYTGISQGSISRYCTGKLKWTKTGLTFRYFTPTI